MKIFKLFFAVAAFVVSLGAQATTYDFSLTTTVGYSISGSFQGTFDANNSTFQAPSSFSGSLIRSAGSGADTGIVSGAISGLTVNTDGTGWQLGFTVTSGGDAAYYLWNTETTGASLSLSGMDMSAAAKKVNIQFSNKTTDISDKISGTPTPYIGVQVPEIDGSKLPQAALLILALVFMVSRLKAARPRFNGQFA